MVPLALSMGEGSSTGNRTAGGLSGSAFGTFLVHTGSLRDSSVLITLFPGQRPTIAFITIPYVIEPINPKMVPAMKNCAGRLIRRKVVSRNGTPI